MYSIRNLDQLAFRSNLRLSVTRKLTEQNSKYKDDLVQKCYKQH